MRRWILILLFLPMLILPVSAEEYTAPAAPESAQEYMPENTQSFSEGLWYVVKTAIGKLQPSIAQCAGVCVGLIAICLLVSLLRSFQDGAKQVVELVGTVTIGTLLLKTSGSLISLGAETVTEMSEYGKLLLPVMTAALAAQGGTTSSAALYTGTAIFNTVLSAFVSRLIVPMIYVYLCLAIANSAIGEEVLKNLRNFVKWLMTWSLKIVLYVFTGYMSITGVVSGTVDSSAIKAAKLTISGVVPVVGGIISDASEALLVSAGLIKNSAGIYGLFAIIALWIGPFLKIGTQYLMLKITASVCSVFGNKHTTDLLHDFTGGMGLLLAMTGTVCVLFLISIICFMKGGG